MFCYVELLEIIKSNDAKKKSLNCQQPHYTPSQLNEQICEQNKEAGLMPRNALAFRTKQNTIQTLKIAEALGTYFKNAKPRKCIVKC